MNSNEDSKNDLGETSKQMHVNSNPIEILLPPHGYVPERFRVSGINGLPIALPVTIWPFSSGPPLGNGPVQPDGSWQVDVAMPSGVTEMEIYATQGDNRNPDSYRRVHTYLTTLTKPIANAILRADQVVFGGSRYPNTRIWVSSSPVQLVYLGNVLPELTWEAKPEAKMSSGFYLVRAEYKVGNLTGTSLTPEVPIIVVGEPDITSPSVQQTRFKLEGKGALEAAKIEVKLEFGGPMIGETTARVGGFWSVDVELPPGPASLIAEQIYSNVRSLPGAPQGFKIRPPKLASVTVTHPTEKTTKFSGLGYSGATIQITVESGPTVTPPPLVEVERGEWTTIATDWPFGSYRLRAIQKVSDRAGGWIESLPYSFSIDPGLPDVSEVFYTPEYRPEFSGKGFNGATVRLVDVPDGTNKVAPDARVSGERWSSPASEVWGPTLKRKVYIKQFLSEESEEWSPTWVEVEVTIPPLAPGLNEPVDNGLSPNFSGTCWPGATLKLTFNDDGVMHTIVDDDNDGRWAFRRDTPFEPDVHHTATLIQTAAEQDSPATFKVFTVSMPMLQPVITYPDADDRVGRNVIVIGDNGMTGATMQLHDVQFERPLGEPKLLTADGEWSIELSGLEFRKYFLRAEQELNGQSSERSDQRVFNVVLLPPEFVEPQPGGNLPRTSELSGRGIPNGRVTVWLQGQADPLRENIFVNSGGDWKTEVTLPIGSTTVRAKQIFIDEKGDEQTSDFSSWLTYNVVPAAPFIETPATGEHIGSNVVVSGFGIPGDTVTVRLNDASRTVLASGPVLEDRTWSVTVTLETPGGAHELLAVAKCEGFESADSPRAVVLGSYLPSIDRPAAGRWVDNPVTFVGRGRAGSGRVVSWYNPELDWAAALGVTAGQWQGEATQMLVSGGQWCRFKQTLTDGADGATVSDWVESGRFEMK
jgi:hypothetical protein